MAKPIPLRRAATVEPRERTVAPAPADPMRVLEVAAERGRAGVPGAMATVLARHGSAPGSPGQKLYVAADGTAIGTVGGGAVEREVAVALVAMAAAGAAGGDAKHELRTFRLGAELGMCCGGSVDVLLEPIAALVPCLVVGGGHVATAVAPMLARVGFAVTVADEREAWAAEGRLAGVRSVLASHDEAGKDVAVSGAVLVMTHDHALDQEAIEWALRRGYAFVGGVGSRAKAKRTRDRLEAKGFSEADRERVRMPMGVDIGARLPDEIAVSIAAEMVAWRKQRGGGTPSTT